MHLGIDRCDIVVMWNEVKLHSGFRIGIVICGKLHESGSPLDCDTRASAAGCSKPNVTILCVFFATQDNGQGH